MSLPHSVSSETECHVPRAGALQQLRILDLSNNNISGVLRASWAGLPSLTLLDVSSNSFNGTVPGSLFRAPLLETALLQDNSLTGALPASQGERIFFTPQSCNHRPQCPKCAFHGFPEKFWLQG